MRRALATVCLVLACFAAMVLAPAAGAAAPAKVKVGAVRLVEPPQGAALLVAVRYPIQLAGRAVTLRVSVARTGVGTLRTWRIRTRVAQPRRRAPERRKHFAFVHSVAVSTALAAQIREGATVRVLVGGRLDVEGDGVAELSSRDSSVQPLRMAAGHRLCASVPPLRTEPGQPLELSLPACSGPTRWLIGVKPDRGNASLRGDKLVYRSGKAFHGTASLVLMAAPTAGVRATSKTAPAVPVQITVGSAKPPVVRAIGDSVTAAFGYYDDGSLMSALRLFSCRPPVKYDDACSSNSKVTSNEVEGVEYAADYGLSNNVSWVAQWANEHGVTNFKNFAVSGSRPQDWFGKGMFASTTEELESEDPDYVLLTLGANPILTETLFGIDNMECAIWSDIFGNYRECVERAFAKVNLAENLRGIYSELVKNTDAQIMVMQYHLSVPAAALAYTAVQIAETAKLMNREIATAAAAVSESRIDVVAPPHFNVGIDIAPVYPAKYKCKGLLFDSRVDGPSVQATPSQVFLRATHPLEFCAGPVSGPPWVISGDTGVHPSAAGYAQMASQVPAPE